MELNGKDHIDTANCYNNIGIANYYKGDYKIALKNHEISLEINKLLNGEQNPESVKSFNNIGTDNYFIGNYEVAF